MDSHFHRGIIMRVIFHGSPGQGGGNTWKHFLYREYRENRSTDLCEMSMCEPCELLEMLWHGAHQKGTVLFLCALCALCYDATRWVCMYQTRCGSEAPKAAGNCLVPHGNPRAKITNVLNYPNYPRIPPLPPLYHCITKGWGHAARLNRTELTYHWCWIPALRPNSGRNSTLLHLARNSFAMSMLCASESCKESFKELLVDVNCSILSTGCRAL